MKKLLKCVDWDSKTKEYCFQVKVKDTCDGCEYAVNGWCQYIPVIMFASIFGDTEEGGKEG